MEKTRKHTLQRGIAFLMACMMLLIPSASVFAVSYEFDEELERELLFQYLIDYVNYDEPIVQDYLIDPILECGLGDVEQIEAYALEKGICDESDFEEALLQFIDLFGQVSEEQMATGVEEILNMSEDALADEIANLEGFTRLIVFYLEALEPFARYLEEDLCFDEEIVKATVGTVLLCYAVNFGAINNIFPDDYSAAPASYSDETEEYGYSETPDLYTENYVYGEDGTGSGDSGRSRAMYAVNYVTVYSREYYNGSIQYGGYRNGVSATAGRNGGTLSMSHTQSTTFNISFTAKVSGQFYNKSKIGGDLGVTLGASKSYATNQSYSCPLKANESRTIQYRPGYYHVRVVETKWKEAYIPGVGWHRYKVGTRECYVDKFNAWHFRDVSGLLPGDYK